MKAAEINRLKLGMLKTKEAIPKRKALSIPTNKNPPKKLKSFLVAKQ